jgi:broad specificity phosphatase PhoE
VLTDSCSIGETEWAKTGRFTSFTEIDLTQKGVTQVLSAAAKLVGPGKLLDLCQLVHVFVSPRVRAKKTFELLLPVPSDVLAGKVTYTDTITEWNYGEYEGLTDPEIRHLRKSNGLDKESQWDIWADGCEGGEYVDPLPVSCC